MGDTVPHFDIGLTDEGDPVILVGEAGEEAHDISTLLNLAPGVTLPAHAAEAARLVNHLAYGSQYAVINDPAAFERAYRDRLASEDPDQPFRPGVSRLSDFGIPDFTEIAPPRFFGDELVFFAADRFLGVPYRVQLATISAASEYTPVALQPLPSSPSSPAAPLPAEPSGAPEPKPVMPAPKPAYRPLTPDDEAARTTHTPNDLPPPQ